MYMNEKMTSLCKLKPFRYVNESKYFFKKEYSIYENNIKVGTVNNHELAKRTVGALNGSYTCGIGSGYIQTETSIGLKGISTLKAFEALNDIETYEPYRLKIDKDGAVALLFEESTLFSVTGVSNAAMVNIKDALNSTYRTAYELGYNIKLEELKKSELSSAPTIL